MADAPFTVRLAEALATLAAGAATFYARWRLLRGRKPAGGPTRPGVLTVQADRAARVVVVENELVLLELLSTTLRGAGFEIAAEALGIHEALRIDLRGVDAAVVDIRLNGTSGLEMIEHCRRVVPKMCIIAMSGDEGMTVDAIRAGADDFFTKGVGSRGLIEMLNRLLARPTD